MTEIISMPPIPPISRRMAAVTRLDAYTELAEFLGKDGAMHVRRVLREPGWRDYLAQLGYGERRGIVLDRICRRLVELGEPAGYFQAVGDLLMDAPEDADELEER